jgi:glycosyltransferase involved in cell wall biosynthesis
VKPEPKRAASARLVVAAEIFDSPSGGLADVTSDWRALMANNASCELLTVSASGVQRTMTVRGTRPAPSAPTVFSGFQAMERYMMRASIEPIACVILNLKDLHYLREQRHDALTGAGRDIDGIKRRELRCISLADVVLTYSGVEKRILEAEIGHDRVLAHAIDLPHLPQAAATDVSSGHLAIVGNFDHAPNADGVAWLFDVCAESLVQAGRRVRIYGRKAERLPSVPARLADWVEVAGPYAAPADPYVGAAALLCPVRFGAGVRVKLIEAALMGVPIVSTSAGLEGLPLDDASALRFDDHTDLGEALAKLDNQPSQVREKACRARAAVAALHNPDNVRAVLRRAVHGCRDL